MNATAQQQEEKLVTRVLVSDLRVCVIGHSANKAACVAITSAVQTFAAIANKLEVVRKIEFNDEQPIYDVQIEPESKKLAAKLISGLMFAFRGIAMQCPGAMEVHDSRKR